MTAAPPAAPGVTPRADHILTRPDGRRVAWAEWGAPDGWPLLLAHRSPGSRLFDPDPTATAAAGVRLITVDRPGYGGTDPVAAPSGPALADDVVTLAAHMDLEDLALAGWSGGGTFALHAVPALGRRLGSLSLLVTPAPDAAVAWWPDTVRPAVPGIQADPAGSLAGMTEAFAPMLADPAALAAVDPSPADAMTRTRPGVVPALTAMNVEAGRQGAAGAAADTVAGSLEEPLPLDAVDVPVALWYGADDHIHPGHAHWYAERLPTAELRVLPAAGHLLPLDHWAAILAAAAPR